jgi:hypothetical protein
MMVVRPWVGGAVEDDVVECMVYLANGACAGVLYVGLNGSRRRLSRDFSVLPRLAH